MDAYTLERETQRLQTAVAVRVALEKARRRQNVELRSAAGLDRDLVWEISKCKRERTAEAAANLEDYMGRRSSAAGEQI